MDINKQTAQEIKENINNLSEKIIIHQYNSQPHFKKIYQSVGHIDIFNDIKTHISYLAEAIFSLQPKIFNNYVNHAETILENIALPQSIFLQTINSTSQILKQNLSGTKFNLVNHYIKTGKETIGTPKYSINSFISAQSKLPQKAEQYLKYLLDNQPRQATDLIFSLIKTGVELEDIYLHIFQPVQSEIGLLFHLNEINTAQEHYCTRQTKRIMSQLFSYYYPVSTPKQELQIITSCVENEAHDIGLRMLGDFFKLQGWNVYHTGANTKISDILERTLSLEADLIALSASNAKNLSTIEQLTSIVNNSSEYQEVKIIVGGYLFNLIPNLWQQLGADGYAKNPREAIQVVKRLIKPKQ